LPAFGRVESKGGAFRPGLSSVWMPASLDGLDRAQLAAVTHRGGPLLILGGPGTGKTHVLAHRAAWLVEEGTAAESVLLLAPTTAAAADLRARVETLIDTPYDELSVYGAQALCERILRDEALEGSTRCSLRSRRPTAWRCCSSASTTCHCAATRSAATLRRCSPASSSGSTA
jgi:hypothetical protein